MRSLQAYISNIDPLLLVHVKGKMGEFIRAFQQHKFASEEAFIKHICSDKYSKRHYDNLKYRTKKVLQALAIVSSFQGAGEVKKKLDLCRKNFTIGQKFLEKGERYEGLRLIKQAYRDAVAYDFVHMACELSNILYFHYVYYERDKKKAAFYAAQVKRYTNEYKAEKEAEYYMFEVIAQTRERPNLEFLKEAMTQIEALESQSLKSRIYQLMIAVPYGFNTRNYQLVIDSCIHGLDFFKGKKGVYLSHYFFFHSSMGIARMAVGQYDKADDSLNQAKNYAHRRSINEVIIPLYQTINALHAGQYHKAYDLYRQNRKCKFEEVRQQFAIIEAYLFFLSHLGYLQIDRIFRLGKYLNETFKAQTDKQGSNISILIAELLVYLAKDRSKFIDRVEAINNYSYRHLKGEDTRRAKRFMKILCLMPRANFNPIALRRITQHGFFIANPFIMLDSRLLFHSIHYLFYQSVERF